ncbi:uncharacterized protein LOC108741477 [Agrilus planipennis]|uniref:Uncharacterized protein LOC108741477 n=1 Tax=Agrilus planipennis TaxID=224129 RepID=A0A1W4XG98_AGRPL|nr:uncharacterized protein LOC108741477 [Agrilus planipennis]XP_018331803.1 uncharacterized protein LOC108741477 [Agrilus planipennis]
MKASLMKTTKKVKYRGHLHVLFLFLVFAISSEICHGYKDITVEYEFGCTWLGGSMSGTLTCSCFEGAKEMYLQKGDIPSFDTFAINIKNCNSVKFGSEVIATSRNLRTIQLANINNLNFEESSLFWDGYAENINPFSYAQSPEYADRTMPGLKISIINSTIHDIARYTFKGRMNEIVFKNVSIDQISSFAFTSLVQTVRVEFIDTAFKTIHPQAFKKFTTNNLLLSGDSFESVPSRAFSEVVVLESFSIKNCKFSRVYSSAFIIKDPRYFDILNSQFDILDGDGFKVTTRGDVGVKGNIFNITNGGAFLGIQLNMEQVAVEQKFIFDNDTFNALHGDTLVVDSIGFQPVYTNIFLNQLCDCWVIEDKKFFDEIKCLLENGERVTMKEYKDHNCSVFSGISLVIIVVVVVLTLLVIIVPIVAVYIKRTYKGTKQKEYISDKNGKPLALILPDGRTYKETELHVIVERTDLLTTDL